MTNANLQKRDALTQARLKELVSYDPLSGLFTSLTNRSGPKRKSKFLDAINNEGYVYFHVDGVTYLAHRLAVLYMTGQWPEHEVDHRNRIRNDNRWVNLRAASDLENPQNRRVRADNRVGITGVHWHKAAQKWVACISANRRRVHLGVFDTPDAAAAAYAIAKAEMHPFQPEVIP